MVRRAAPYPVRLGPLLLGLLVGCGESGGSTPKPNPFPSSTTADAPLASASTSASAPSPDHPWTGVWSGRFEAKKGGVGVPEGVAYPVWEKEDGTDASGTSAVELTVAPDGEVTGKGRGALGAFVLRGRVERQMLRCGVTPAQPDAEVSMSGVLTAKEKDAGKTLEATLRVAGGKGARVRTATFVLAEGALGDDVDAEMPTPTASATASAPGAP